MLKVLIFLLSLMLVSFSHAKADHAYLVAFGEGQGTLVQVGYIELTGENWRSAIFVSKDHVHWTEAKISSDAKAFLTGVAYGANTFVAIGWNERNTTLVSNDGINWEKINIESASVQFDCITFFNSQFLALDNDAYLWTSIDGKKWMKRQAFDIGWNPKFAINKQSIVLTGEGNAVYTSKDGLEWERYQVGGSDEDPRGYNFNALIAEGDGFTGILTYDGCAGEDEECQEVYSIQFSPNELSHAKISLIRNKSLFSTSKIAIFNGHYIAATKDGVHYSQDLSAWKKSVLPNEDSKDVGQADFLVTKNSIYVLREDRIYNSIEGKKWRLSWKL